MDFLKFLKWFLKEKNEHQINKGEIVKYINENILAAANSANDYQDAKNKIDQLLSNSLNIDFLKFLKWFLERKTEHQINKGEIVEYINENIFSDANSANDYQDARKKIDELLLNFK